MAIYHVPVDGGWKELSPKEWAEMKEKSREYATKLSEETIYDELQYHRTDIEAKGKTLELLYDINENLSEINSNLEKIADRL